jgi:site-specific recombinase XerD
MGLFAHLGRWLADAGLDTQALDESTVGSYFAARRNRGYAAFVTPKALMPLLEYLRGLGTTPNPVTAAPASLAEQLLEDFRRYLRDERCLRPKVIRGYVDAVGPFVAEVAESGHDQIARVSAGQVSGFLVAQVPRLAPKTIQRMAAALRSLLRFWHVQGLIAVRLDVAVPKVVNRRRARPRALPPVQVQAMLASCDESWCGLRDKAILTMLARLGLRAGEVAVLRLDDIDWRDGVITVGGKGGRGDRLPLPVDVGEALIRWLRHGRPATASDRSVFTRVRAPHRGLTAGGVTQVVAAAARRAGLGVVHAHRLRHSAATSMLAQGASLAEIGQVLRHRRPLTTSVYAKVDTAALRVLARPWPGGS